MGINRTSVARKWHNAVLSVIGGHGAVLSIHLRATLVNEVILGFVLVLMALLVMSLAAIARMPRSSSQAAEQPEDETPDMLAQFMPGVSPSTFPPVSPATFPTGSPWQPSDAGLGQRSYAEAAYRLWPGRPGAPPPPGAPGRLGEAGEARAPDPGAAPWQQPARPQQVRGGPPWGPAPRPESEPPSWAQPPGRP